MPQVGKDLEGCKDEPRFEAATSQGDVVPRACLTQGMKLSLLICGLIFCSQPTRAVCLKHPTVKQELAEAKMVVIAHLVSQKENTDRDGGLVSTTYKLKVSNVLKGKPTTYVTTVSDNDDGRFWIDPGADYLLFITHWSGQDRVDSCGHSDLLTKSRRILSAISSKHSK